MLYNTSYEKANEIQMIYIFMNITFKSYYDKTLLLRRVSDCFCLPWRDDV